MRKIIVTRDPAKINLAVLKLVEQLGDLTTLSTLASDADYARNQAVAAAAASQENRAAAEAAKASAEAAQSGAVGGAGVASGAATAAIAAQATALEAQTAAEIARGQAQGAAAVAQGAASDAAGSAAGAAAAMAGSVRFDAAQALSAAEKTQARLNLDLNVFQRLLGVSRMQAPNLLEDIRVYEDGVWGAYSDTLTSWRALGVGQGGTGALTAAGARSNLGLGAVATDNVVPVGRGGTGGTTPDVARYNLNAAMKLPPAGAVESLVWAHHVATDVVYGGTYGGGSLRPTGAAASIYVIGTGFTASASLGGYLSGTWACLGQGIRNSTTPGISAVDFAYLFQRIA